MLCLHHELLIFSSLPRRAVPPGLPHPQDSVPPQHTSSPCFPAYCSISVECTFSNKKTCALDVGSSCCCNIKQRDFYCVINLTVFDSWITEMSSYCDAPLVFKNTYPLQIPEAQSNYNYLNEENEALSLSLPPSPTSLSVASILLNRE